MSLREEEHVCRDIRKMIYRRSSIFVEEEKERKDGTSSERTYVKFTYSGTNSFTLLRAWGWGDCGGLRREEGKGGRCKIDQAAS